ncbi:hypothetical protein vseg_004068 [Gypsophila vaccaria]
MAIKAGNKLTKLRSALKKMNSFGKPRRENTNTSNTSNNMILPTSTDECGELHTVYVGKSMRPYHVSQQVLDHPVIQELVGRRSDGCDEFIVIGCEVVLFEHLLWMLHNSDAHSEPLDDLVHFYAY